MVGMISAVKRMHREAAACDENRPITENTVMADSLRSTEKNVQPLSPQAEKFVKKTDLCIMLDHISLIYTNTSNSNIVHT